MAAVLRTLCILSILLAFGCDAIRTFPGDSPVELTDVIIDQEVKVLGVKEYFIIRNSVITSHFALSGDLKWRRVELENVTINGQVSITAITNMEGEDSTIIFRNVRVSEHLEVQDRSTVAMPSLELRSGASVVFDSCIIRAAVATSGRATVWGFYLANPSISGIGSSVTFRNNTILPYALNAQQTDWSSGGILSTGGTFTDGAALRIANNHVHISGPGKDSKREAIRVASTAFDATSRLTLELPARPLWVTHLTPTSAPTTYHTIGSITIVPAARSTNNVAVAVPSVIEFVHGHQLTLPIFAIQNFTLRHSRISDSLTLSLPADPSYSYTVVELVEAEAVSVLTDSVFETVVGRTHVSVERSPTTFVGRLTFPVWQHVTNVRVADTDAAQLNMPMTSQVSEGGSMILEGVRLGSLLVFGGEGFVNTTIRNSVINSLELNGFPVPPGGHLTVENIFSNHTQLRRSAMFLQDVDLGARSALVIRNNSVPTTISEGGRSVLHTIALFRVGASEASVCITGNTVRPSHEDFRSDWAATGIGIVSGIFTDSNVTVSMNTIRPNAGGAATKWFGYFFQVQLVRTRFAVLFGPRSFNGSFQFTVMSGVADTVTRLALSNFTGATMPTLMVPSVAMDPPHVVISGCTVLSSWAAAPRNSFWTAHESSFSHVTLDVAGVVMDSCVVHALTTLTLYRHAVEGAVAPPAVIVLRNVTAAKGVSVLATTLRGTSEFIDVSESHLQLLRLANVKLHDGASTRISRNRFTQPHDATVTFHRIQFSAVAVSGAGSWVSVDGNDLLLPVVSRGNALLTGYGVYMTSGSCDEGTSLCITGNRGLRDVVAEAAAQSDWTCGGINIASSSIFGSAGFHAVNNTVDTGAVPTDGRKAYFVNPELTNVTMNFDIAASTVGGLEVVLGGANTFSRPPYFANLGSTALSASSTVPASSVSDSARNDIHCSSLPALRAHAANVAAVLGALLAASEDPSAIEAHLMGMSALSGCTGVPHYELKLEAKSRATATRTQRLTTPTVTIPLTPSATKSADSSGRTPFSGTVSPTAAFGQRTVPSSHTAAQLPHSRDTVTAQPLHTAGSATQSVSSHAVTQGTANDTERLAAVKEQGAILDEDAAVTVTATAAVASIGASVASPTAASNMGRFLAARRMYDCTFLASESRDEDGAGEPPGLIEHPLRFGVATSRWRGETTAAVIGSTAIIGVFAAATAVCYVVAALRPATFYASLALLLVLAYLGPNIAGSSAAVGSSAPDPADPAALTVVVAVCSMCVFAVVLGMVWVLVRIFPARLSSEAQTRRSSRSAAGSSDAAAAVVVVVGWKFVAKRPELVDSTADRGRDCSDVVDEPPLVGVVTPLLDPVRDPTLIWCRLLFTEDVLLASATAGVAGIHPSRPAHCTIMGFAVLALAVAHVVFLVVVRPYLAQRDTIFALLWAGNACVIAMVALAGALSEPTPALSTAIDLALLVQTAAFVVQPAVELYFWCRHRRQARDGLATHGTELLPPAHVGGTTPASSAVAAPLLVAPVSERRGAANSSEQAPAVSCDSHAAAVPFVANPLQR